MLERLQQQLHEIYATEATHDVRDFLVTDAHTARVISGDNTLTRGGETLLLSEDEEGLLLSLYLDNRLFERLDSGSPVAALQAGQLDDLCMIIEGLSHFNYVVWRASRDRSVSLLELELQAEVDKFVSTMQLAREQNDTELMTGLHGRLFDNVQFHEHLNREQLERYRTASSYAAHFCQGLKRGLTYSADKTLFELRRFYRMTLGDKISHIHSCAWT